MKKILIPILIFSLLIVTSSYAQNTIWNPSNGSMHNLGDHMTITGQITTDSDVSGAKVVFYAHSTDMAESVDITTKYYSFYANTPVTFSQINKNVLTWVVPSTINKSGDWRVIAEVYDDYVLIKKLQSNEFIISDDLIVVSSVNSRVFNLGETLELSGTVLNARGDPIGGTADVRLVEADAGQVSSSSEDFTGGYLYYTYKFQEGDPSGRYSVAVDLSDSDGNSGYSNHSAIRVSNMLEMGCYLREYELDPGDTVVLIGSLKDIHDRALESVPTTAFMFNPARDTSVKYETLTDANGNFAFDIELTQLATPGEYTLDLQANDSSGNEGICVETFLVGSEIKLEADLEIANKTWFYPDEEMGLEIEVENKGNTDLEGTAEIHVDGSKVLEADFSVSVGEKSVLEERWDISADLGNHTIGVLLYVDEDKLAETQPQQFEIVERPAPPVQFEFQWWHGLLIVIIAILLIFMYLKRQVIKEALWRRQLGKSFKQY